jgi:hypothetical protein
MSVRFGGIRRQTAFGLAAASFVATASCIGYYFRPAASSDDAYGISDLYDISIARSLAAKQPEIRLGVATDILFAQNGKQDRADYVERLAAAARKTAVMHADASDTAAPPQSKTTEYRPFVAATLTPIELSRPGPTRTASLYQQAVNRGGKTDRIRAPEMSVAKFVVAGPQVDEASEASAEGVSAALFMLAPFTDGGPSQAAEAQDAVLAANSRPVSRTTWEDLIKLARVGGGDGERIESGIFGNLTENEFRAREFRCMTTAIYFEARGENIKGQTAVGQVIMTRVRSDYYPNTICGVVYQGQWNRNACQFSFACDGRADTPKNKAQWQTAINVAKKVISGEAYVKEVGAATHYHATYVSPDWRKLMKRVAKVGVHIFYKAPFVRPLVASNEFEKL